jgi:hypothetical protein
MTQIPVDSNFRPDGMFAPVVGGKPVFCTETEAAKYIRTGNAAPATAGIPLGRFLAFDPTGDATDNVPGTTGDFPSEHLPRFGVDLPGAGFTAADFAGISGFQRALPNYSIPARMGQVTPNDFVPAHLANETVNRAVYWSWWVQFDNVAPPVREGVVFVDNTTAGAEGQASIATGVALPAEVITFLGPEYVVTEGANGLAYAAVKFNQMIV